MGAQSETQRAEFRGWTLRIRPTSAQVPRLLLLLHGWTGDENSMWVFARNLPRDYCILAPRAPHAARPSGYSWRLGASRQGAGPALKDLRPAGQALLSMLDEWSAEAGVSGRPWSVVGFSQGAVMACTIALLYPQRVDRLVMLAGFMPSDAAALAPALPLRDKQVLIVHGSRDETVDIEWGRKAAQILLSAGARVDFCEDEVGHKVGVDCLRRLQAFLA